MKITGILTAVKLGLPAPRVQSTPAFMQPAGTPKINKQLKQRSVNYSRVYSSGK